MDGEKFGKKLINLFQGYTSPEKSRLYSFLNIYFLKMFSWLYCTSLWNWVLLFWRKKSFKK